jgi:hypothetical protein
MDGLDGSNDLDDLNDTALPREGHRYRGRCDTPDRV